MGIEQDLGGLEQQIRQNGPRQVSEYAPRRVRTDREIATTETATAASEPERSPLDTPALSKEIEDTAFRFSRMVANLQEAEKRAQADLAHANARIEQYESRVADLLSQLETARLQMEEANRRTETERAEQVRLATLFETIGGNVADALHGRKPQ